MRKFVIIKKFRIGDVRIYLRRGQRLVPQQTLYGAQVGAIIEHVGGKTVPQNMR